MATCPNCGAYLDTNHQCRGLWRLRLRLWSTIAFGGVIGAAGVGVVVIALYGTVSSLAILIGATLGGLVAFAYLRGEP